MSTTPKRSRTRMSNTVRAAQNGIQLRTEGRASPETIEKRLRQIAELDIDFYVKVRAVLDNIKGNTTYAQERRAFLTLLALESINRPATQAEVMYATLRVRHKYTHNKAMIEAGLPVGWRHSIDTADCCLALQKELQRQYEIIRKETSVTREDVIAGMMNAVNTASTSTELLFAWKELGKLLGYYEETKVRIEQTVKQQVTHTVTFDAADMRMMTNEDLLKHIKPEVLDRLKLQADGTYGLAPQEQLQHVEKEVIDVVPEHVPARRGRDTEDAGRVGRRGRYLAEDTARADGPEDAGADGGVDGPALDGGVDH